MWLCTSPAYDTVHMRSIAIEIRLHKNSGYLCCSYTHTDDRLRLSLCLYPNCTVSTTCFLIHVNTTRATVLALVGKKKKAKKRKTFFFFFLLTGMIVVVLRAELRLFGFFSADLHR